MIQEEKSKYGITLSDEEISKLSKNKFKQIVNKCVNKFAFNYLLNCAEQHSKSKNILKNLQNTSSAQLETQPYLLSEHLSKTECQLLFSLRCRNLDVKTNFKILYKNDLSCRTCRESNITENEQHILECKGLISENDDPFMRYEDVFGDLNSQIRTVQVFKKVLIFL